MSDAPEDEAPPAAKTPRKRPARRVSKTAAAAPAETVVPLSSPEPPAASAPAPVEPPAPPVRAVAPEPEREREREHSPEPQRRDDFESPDPIATFVEPPSSDAQGSGKKRRRRKKNKHGGQGGQSQGGAAPQIFQTAPTQGYVPAPPPPDFRESPQAPAPSAEGHAPTMQAQGHAPQRPRIDADQIAKKAWKIFLAEVSEEGLALIGDNDARELSRRSFRLAEVFMEEAARRQHR